MLEMFIKYPSIYTGVGKDDYVDAAEKFYVCCMELKKRMLRVVTMRGIVFFVKAKRDLKMLPPTHNAKELNIKRPNYQA